MGLVAAFGWRRLLRWFSIAAVAFVVIAMSTVVGYNVYADRAVTEADNRAHRDPITRVLRGAEDGWLTHPKVDRAVLFVHGFVGAQNNFAKLPDRVHQLGWNVRRVRLPGHGTSPRDYEKTTPDELVTAVTDEVRAARSAGNRTVVLVAHSMGGALAVLAAGATDPSVRIDGIVLGAPYFAVAHRWYYGLRPETWTELTAPVIRWVHKSEAFIQVNRPEAKKEIVSYEWVPTKGLLTLQELGRRASSPESLGGVRCPVLIVHSPIDKAADFGAAKAAHEGMVHAKRRFVELERSNHHIYWDFEAETVFSEVERFLAGM